MLAGFHWCPEHGSLHTNRSNIPVDYSTSPPSGGDSWCYKCNARVAQVLVRKPPQQSKFSKTGSKKAQARNLIYEKASQLNRGELTRCTPSILFASGRAPREEIQTIKRVFGSRAKITGFDWDHGALNPAIEAGVDDFLFGDIGDINSGTPNLVRVQKKLPRLSTKFNRTKSGLWVEPSPDVRREKWLFANMDMCTNMDGHPESMFFNASRRAVFLATWISMGREVEKFVRRTTKLNSGAGKQYGPRWWGQFPEAVRYRLIQLQTNSLADWAPMMVISYKISFAMMAVLWSRSVADKPEQPLFIKL